MKLSSKTSINELLKKYPFLIDFLVDYNSQFGMLKNKVMRATVGKLATLKKVAGIGGITVNVLIKDIAAEIEKRTGDIVDMEIGEEAEISADREKVAILKDRSSQRHSPECSKYVI